MTQHSTTTPAAVSSVHSPLGIRLVTGLLAPFLTQAGQTEVEQRWGLAATALFKDSLALAETLATEDTVHAALGVWTRNHLLPAQAAAMLGDYLLTLPDDIGAAQQALDAWASLHTQEMIPSFPVPVRPETLVVLASALAIEDTWAHGATKQTVTFAGERTKGFVTHVGEEAVRSTSDGRAVQVRVPLSSGMEMTFVASTAGAKAAATLLEVPQAFTVEARPGQPFVSTVETTQKSTEVIVSLPEYTTRSRLDLTGEAERWGLVEAMKPHGVPGLLDLEVSEAAQDAFIEVTHTGVRAAAVTAMSFAAAALFQPETFLRKAVDFTEPFAYAITIPGTSVPLFAGIHAG